MQALTWYGTYDVRVDNVDDPEIQEPRDAFIKVIATAICGSDLHLYNGLMGGIPGGQAEYVRVLYADVGPIKIESDLRDDQVLFLSDISPTGYMAVDNCDMEAGDTVAIWRCGPVGQFAVRSAWMRGQAG